MKTLFLTLALSVSIIIAYFFYHNKKTQQTIPTDNPSPSYTGGTYELYNPDNLPTSGQIILFFHADRCATCIAFEENILASGIPTDMHIRKIDYDTTQDLKQQYNILSQTSFVHIQPDGTMIQRRVGARNIASIREKINDTTIKPRQQAPSEKIIQENTTKTAYFAGGCFRCLEGPLEATSGVQDVISGYIGGTKDTADYTTVVRGKTKHREAVQVSYNPSLISFQQLIDVFYYQIDPTDAGGQFADRGYQYTTAIYYDDPTKKDIAQKALAQRQESGEFDQPIATSIEPVTAFYPAEQEHQNFYKTNADYYQRYKKGSGRADYIDQRKSNSPKQEQPIQPSNTRKETLTDLQKEVLYNKGTEKPFENAYRDNHDQGIYVDIVDGTPLFSSTDKFDSGTGRPSFNKPIEESIIDLEQDTRYGMTRTEVETDDGKHLGHVFNDGPNGTQRYCINSAALKFIPIDEMEKLGYGQYVSLFE